MPDDYSATISTSGSISVGGTAWGEIETGGDQDWFRTTLYEGRTYTLLLEGSAGGGGTLVDPFLRGIRDASGALLPATTDDDGGAGRDSMLNYSPTATGTYFISAGAFGGYTGSYTLSLLELDSGDDYADNATTRGMVSEGSPAVGEIEVDGDIDWFSMRLNAGTTYRIELLGTSTGDGTLNDPYIRGLYTASSSLIPGSFNDDGGTGLNSLIEFTPATSGTYYVAAGAFSLDTGTYTVSVSDIDLGDDHPDNPSTTATVAVGGSSRGELETDYDEDWFGIEMVAGHSYRIDMLGASTSDGTLDDPYIRGIHDSVGNLISGTQNDDGGVGLNSMIEFTASVSGTHFVSAGAFWGTGTYTVAVTDLGTLDDYGSDTGRAGSISVGGTATGEIEQAEDRDWFAVTLRAGQTYQVELRGSQSGDGSLNDPYLRGIFDSDGRAIMGTSNDDGGAGLNSLLNFRADTDGTYYISAGGFGMATGTYTMEVSEQSSSDDFLANTDTTGVIGGSGVATGDIETAGDRDWFRIELSEGHSYRIGVEGSYSGGGTLLDPYLDGVYDRSGSLLPNSSNDDGGVGLDSLREFAVASSGTYYVSAAGYGSNTGTYRVTVEDLGGSGGREDDYGTTPGSSGSVAVDGTATGAIEVAHDEDWFAVDLEAGETYTIGVQGSATGGGTLSDPYLFGIYDASGSLLDGTTDDDSGTWLNSEVEFTAASSGRHFISAGAYWSDTGTYTVSVDRAVAVSDDFAGNTGTAGRIVPGGTATGAIENGGDTDWFRIELQAGHAYRVDLEGADTDGGTLTDPYFRGLYDSSGALLDGTSNDDGGSGLNARISFATDTSGTFFLSAGAFGGGTGSYKLSIVDMGVSDEYSADTTTSGAVPVGGSSSGNIETAGDQDWFRVSLTAGTTYQFDLEGSATTTETLSDPYLRGIFDASGEAIARTADDDDGEGLNSMVSFTPTASGEYFVSAGAYGSHTGTYKLTVSETSSGTPSDDHAQDGSTGGRVSVGGSSSGSIETARDQDWFGVRLEAGHTYTIDLEGSATAGGSLSDPYLRGLHDGTGSLIAGTSNDDDGTGTNAQLTFTASSTGMHYISAGAYGSTTGTYKVSVSEDSVTPPPASGFEITIDFEGNDAYRPYFDRAADAWERVITGDLPDVVDSRWGIVDDLRIDAAVTAIDGPGSILGQAGPRDFRAGSALPYNGMMQFDEADLAGMEAKGVLGEVIEHEMGHVLGIGTLWEHLGLRSGFNYTGANAVNEYSTLTGSSQSSVPLESGGGAGTAGSHWSESVFDTELMTGYAENSPPMPLSRMTVGTLQDMGYTVDYAGADPYVLTGSLSSLLAPGGAARGASTGLPDLPPMAALEAPGFSGQRFTNFNSTSMRISSTPVPEKLNGLISEASESSVILFLNSRERRVVVELDGEFQKNNPVSVDELKGELRQASFYESGYLLARYDYSDSPVDVTSALQSWSGFDLDLDNLLESRAPTAQADLIRAGAGNDYLIGGLGDDTLVGGAGEDTVGFDFDSGDATVSEEGGVFTILSPREGVDQISEVESFRFNNETLGVDGMLALAGSGGGGVGPDGSTIGDDLLTGTAGDDTLSGDDGNDTIDGLDGNDRLLGEGDDDLLRGGDGADILNGGPGNDEIIGGATSADRSDTIFGGSGNDNIQAGYGNDLVYGQDGDDSIAGGYGADTLQGQNGDDVITGSAFGDIVFGGNGNDFVNGGFGHDLVNGGDGADRFFHVGGNRDAMMGHGSDWVQDYDAAQGDVLVFGGSATASQFQVNFDHTANRDTGERSGDDGVQEAFVIYRPTGQILWALVDGGGQSSINLTIAGDTFDLLA